MEEGAPNPALPLDEHAQGGVSSQRVIVLDMVVLDP
jgi:hypothetical protein